jgi:hypothetical protein
MTKYYLFICPSCLGRNFDFGKKNPQAIMSTSEFQQLSPVQHMLKYPDLTLGDTTIHAQEVWLMDLEKMSIAK